MTITKTRRRTRAQESADEHTGAKPRRRRRTPEERIADLEAEIARVKASAAAREVKQADEGREFMRAVKAIDKAAKVAQETGNGTMMRALESARAPLSTLMVEMGVRVPVRRRQRAG